MKHRLLLLGLLPALLLGACSAPVAPPAAAPASPQSFVFVHASDPQLGGADGLAPTRQRFEKLVAEVNDLKPAFVLITGDLVDHRDDKEWAAFDQTVARLSPPHHTVRGNHDEPAAYRQRYGKEYRTFDQGNWRFVCLDSTPLTTTPADEGQLAQVRAQLDWLAATLKEAHGQKRILVAAMHHPPSVLTAASKAALDGLFRKYGVTLVLAGHIHRSQDYTDQGGYRVITVAGTEKFFDQRDYDYRVLTCMPDGTFTMEYRTLNTPVATPAPVQK